MPNGRSGGFGIARTELAQLARRLRDRHPYGHSLLPAAPLGSADLLTLLDSFPGEEVWVEEQDHEVYIIHLDMMAHELGDSDLSRWITVRSDSPLFLPLREVHQRNRRHKDPGPGYSD